MAQAKCLNDDCGREEPWTLRKDPAEYASGVRCPDCSTTRVEIIRDEPTGATATAEPAQAQEPAQTGEFRSPGGGQQAQPPAQQQQAQGQQGGMLPDTASQEAIEAGMQGGNAIGTLMNGSRAEKAQALGGAMFQIGQHLAQKEQNAKQASQDEIRTVEEYVECDACGAQLRGVPDRGRFECGNCHTILERVPPGEA